MSEIAKQLFNEGRIARINDERDSVCPYPPKGDGSETVGNYRRFMWMHGYWHEDVFINTGIMLDAPAEAAA